MCKAWQLIFSCFSLCALVKRCLSKEYIPILLTEDDFGTKDNNKIIRYALENQYGEDTDYDVFEQMDAADKVLIVDRYDKISKNRWNNFFNANNSINFSIVGAL